MNSIAWISGKHIWSVEKVWIHCIPMLVHLNDHILATVGRCDLKDLLWKLLESLFCQAGMVLYHQEGINDRKGCTAWGGIACIQQDASNWQDTYWSCGLPPRLLPVIPGSVALPNRAPHHVWWVGWRLTTICLHSLIHQSHVSSDRPPSPIVLGCFSLPPPFTYCALHCMTRIAWLWNQNLSHILLPHCCYTNTLLCKHFEFHPFTLPTVFPPTIQFALAISPHHFQPLHVLYIRMYFMLVR